MTPHPSWIEIDVGQFRKNLAEIRKRIGGALFCLPVKANAYGHGLVEIGKIAEEEGIDCLGVSCLKEGLDLRSSGVRIPILIFGAIHEEQIGPLIEAGLECSISSRYKAELVLQKCRERGLKCKVHLEVDTGMQRTGVRPESAPELLEFLESSPFFEVKGIYSHLATGDVPDHPFAKEQIGAFRALREQLGKRGLIWHLGNSGAVAFYPEALFDMVRPGLLSYGYLPDLCPEMGVRPCLSLKSKISYFKVVGEGRSISYGQLYRTKGETRVVTVPLGYGDGYMRALSNKANVLIRGSLYPIAGAICMDQFMVDLGKGEAYVGDVVTLIGKDGEREVSLKALAALGGTIPYELLTSFGARLPRRYV